MNDPPLIFSFDATSKLVFRCSMTRPNIAYLLHQARLIDSKRLEVIFLHFFLNYLLNDIQTFLGLLNYFVGFLPIFLLFLGFNVHFLT